LEIIEEEKMKRALILCLGILLAGCARDKSTGDWVSQLHDGDPVARLEAIKALGNNSSDVDQAVPALTEALNDPNAFVRRDAARALGTIGAGARPAIPSLTRALKDKEGSVRRAAASALKKIGPAAAFAPHR
jgi:HEAT repeat protein